jgi:hypothetical protein
MFFRLMKTCISFETLREVLIIDVQSSELPMGLAILHILGAEHTLSHFRPVKLRAKLHDGQLEAL